jgi:hypothetical protein
MPGYESNNKELLLWFLSESSHVLFLFVHEFCVFPRAPIDFLPHPSVAAKSHQDEEQFSPKLLLLRRLGHGTRKVLSPFLFAPSRPGSSESQTFGRTGSDSKTHNRNVCVFNSLSYNLMESVFLPRSLMKIE